MATESTTHRASASGGSKPQARSPITAYLARVRALLVRHEARRALLYALAALGAIALLLPLIGHVVGARQAALAVLSIGGLAALLVVIAALVLGYVVPRRRWEADTALARWIGRRHAPIASDLLSSIELADATARPGAPSTQLVEAFVAQTGRRLAELPPGALVPVEEVTRARRWAIAALAANAVIALALPHGVAAGWRRLVRSPRDPYGGAKLSAVPLVGDLNASLQFPAYSHRAPLELPSSSGDVRGLPGTQVTLRARVLAPASAVALVIEPPPGVSGEPRTIAAKLDGDQLHASFAIDHAARYRFEVTSPSGSRAIEATPRAIDVEPDQAPAIQLMAPGDPLDVSNLRRVELAYVIDDDFGVSSAELVWEAGKDRGRLPIALPGQTRHAQGKLMWDLADVTVPSGGEVRYWIEAKDNDTVPGPNTGKSREFHLRVISPRERHEQNVKRQQEVAEKLVRQLGGRLTGPGDDLAAREGLARQLRDAVGGLASVNAAFDKDVHAPEALRKALGAMRDRLDRLATAEQRLLPRAPKTNAGRLFAANDARLVTELEDDTIALADWLDRERLEGLLDISDEIAAHQKRLADLLAQYARTKDPRLLDEIDREMHALDRAYAELDQHAQGMPEDVLDQYVNRDAVQPQKGTTCIDQVRALVHAGKTAAAQAKLASCQQQQGRSAGSLEDSLSQLRGDKFGDEQKKLDEVMNELADLSKDQDDIAGEASRIYDAYSAKAASVARDHRREASRSVGPLIDKLRKRLEAIDEAGLTPFAKEEMDTVQRRLDDVERMVADGDLSEAEAMAKQAKQSLDTVAGELEAALDEEPRSKWAAATQDALDGVSRATPVANDLIDQLASLSPKPDQIMSRDDQQALERLRRRQAMNAERAKHLAERTKQLGGELPGNAAAELGKQLGGALDQMGTADDRMKAMDPSGAREATRAAADALSKARDRARSAARQAQQTAVSDEPVRIPGANEYKAPEQFREDLLEAMKKQGAKAPAGYKQMIDEYYQELIK